MNARAMFWGSVGTVHPWSSLDLQVQGEQQRVQGLGVLRLPRVCLVLGFGFRSRGKVVWWKESKGDVPESRYLLETIKACSL